MSQKVQTLALENFTTFEKAKFDFCPGINVLIGANATGKSHVMKVIYSLLKVCEVGNQRQIKTIQEFDDILYLKLEGVFRFVEIVSDLIRYHSYDRSYSTHTPGTAKIHLDYGANTQLDIQIFSEQTGLGYAGLAGEFETIPREDKLRPIPNPPPTVYLPSREFLSINEGFISAYNKRESAFDETYYDLALDLNASPLRKDNLIEVQEIITFLQELITGENTSDNNIVRQENGRFYFNLPEGDLDVHLVAEGYRKLATLLYLLKNGSLTKNSILFWDEPEANLNPKLVVEVAKVLKILSETGMQIFIATHDYLLSHELSLLKEYPSIDEIAIKFFGLYKPERKSGVLVESGHTLAELDHNPILEEFAAHYDREAALFQVPATNNI